MKTRREAKESAIKIHGMCWVMERKIVINIAPFAKELECGCDFFGRSYHHKDEQDEGKGSCYKTNWARITKEKVAKLVNDKRYGVSEAALVGNRKRCPLGAVHFAADGAHGGEARRAKQVEDKECVSADRGERGGKVGIYRGAFGGVEDTHGANDVLFGKKTGEGSHSCLPCAKAERSKQPREDRADRGENALIKLIFGKHTEAFVGEAEICKEPNDNGGKQNHGACFFDKRPTSFPHRTHDIAEGGEMVGGKFKDKGRGVAREGFGFLQQEEPMQKGWRHSQLVFRPCLSPQAG